MAYAFPHVSKNEFKFSADFSAAAPTIKAFFETDDSHFGLIGSEAIMVVFSETYDSRFGLVGSEAIMV
jgi:hypothetical protein